MPPVFKHSRLTLAIAFTLGIPSFANAVTTIDMTATSPQVLSNIGDIVVIGKAQSNGMHPFALLSIEGYDVWEVGNIINEADLTVNGINSDGTGNGTFYIEDVTVNGDVINRGALHTANIWDIGTDLFDSLVNGRYINEGTISFLQEHPDEAAWEQQGLAASNTSLSIKRSQVTDGLDNRGTIWAQGNNAKALSIRSSTLNGLENHGTLRAMGENSTALLIDSDTSLGSVGFINEGQLLAQGAGSTALLNESSSTTVNRGLIQADGVAVMMSPSARFIQETGGRVEGGDAAITASRTGGTVELRGGSVHGDLIDIGTLEVPGQASIEANRLQVGTARVSGRLTLLNPHTNLSGDLQLQANSALELLLSSATDANRPVLDVGQNIAVADSAKILVTPKPDDFATQGAQQYRLIDATGWYTLDVNTAAAGQPLQESDLTVDSTSALLKINRFFLDNNTLFANLETLSGEEASEVIKEEGADQNAQDALGELTEVIPELPKDDGIFNDIANGDAQRIRQLAEQLLPDVNGGAILAAIGSQRLVTDAIEQRTQSLYPRSGNPNRGGVWIQALNSTADQGHRQGIAGFDMNASGIAFGVDGQLTDDVTMGVAYSYLNSNIKSDNGNKIDSDGYAFSLYSRYQPNAFFVDSSLTYARHDNDSKRHISDTQAKASYDSELFGLNLLTGYRFDPAPGFWIEPRAGIRYSHVKLDGFNEKGSSAALRVNSQRYESGEIGAGIRLGGHFELNQGSLLPEIRLMAWHDAIGDRVSATSSFLLGGSPFVTRGVRQSRDTFEAAAGLDYRLGAFSIGAQYQYTTRSDFDANSVQAHVRYDF